MPRLGCLWAGLFFFQCFCVDTRIMMEERKVDFPFSYYSFSIFVLWANHCTLHHMNEFFFSDIVFLFSETFWNLLVFQLICLTVCACLFGSNCGLQRVITWFCSCTCLSRRFPVAVLQAIALCFDNARWVPQLRLEMLDTRWCFLRSV
jgi:hypothetical protein